MKLHKSQLSRAAQRIARRLLKNSGIERPRGKFPRIYVIRRSRRGEGAVWGRCYWNGPIVLHIGRNPKRGDIAILIAHELAHWVVFQDPSWQIRRQPPHGPRFQWVLWRLIPQHLWLQASTPGWIKCGRHDPSYATALSETLAA